MHGRTRVIHRIEDYQVARAVQMALKPNDADGMTWLLKIYRREESLVDIGPVADSRSGKVSFHSSEKKFMGCNAPVLVVTELLDSAVDLCVQEERLGLI
jgi:hypothetical protein